MSLNLEQQSLLKSSSTSPHDCFEAIKDVDDVSYCQKITSILFYWFQFMHATSLIMSNHGMLWWISVFFYCSVYFGINFRMIFHNNALKADSQLLLSNNCPLACFYHAAQRNKCKVLFLQYKLLSIHSFFSL